MSVQAAIAALGALARPNAPLGALTTYRVGGAAEVLVEADSQDDLAQVHAAIAASGLPVLVVGKGSNLLVADRGFAGIAVLLGERFAGVEIRGDVVSAGGAAALPIVARRTASAGLTGFEWAVGVPGSVGGGVRMNAGGHGAEVKDSLIDATVFDLARGAEELRTNAQLAFAYRRSSLEPAHVVTRARFQLAEGDASQADARISEIVQWRRDNQPGGQNAGSVFTNPEGDSAGRLIDAAGLKGFRVGSAHVSDKHANFFQADPEGSADDVVALIREVRHRVREAMGVDLVPEVRMVGFK